LLWWEDSIVGLRHFFVVVASCRHLRWLFLVLEVALSN